MDDAVLRLKPYQYVHVLDNNMNVTRVEVGPQTLTRQEHEKITALVAQLGTDLAESPQSNLRKGALHALAGAGSMAPPVLQRGVSSVYTGGPAGDGSGHGEDVPLPPFTETALSREVEQSVRTVLAKKFRPVRDGAVLGFPAYDADKNLVGLYPVSYTHLTLPTKA